MRYKFDISKQRHSKDLLFRTTDLRRNIACVFIKRMSKSPFFDEEINRLVICERILNGESPGVEKGRP